MTISERKVQAIYSAVHEAIMRLRIELRRAGVSDRIDATIAQAGDAAGMAAIAAYRTTLKRKQTA